MSVYKDSPPIHNDAVNPLFSMSQMLIIDIGNLSLCSREVKELFSTLSGHVDPINELSVTSNAMHRVVIAKLTETSVVLWKYRQKNIASFVTLREDPTDAALASEIVLSLNNNAGCSEQWAAF